MITKYLYKNINIVMSKKIHITESQYKELIGEMAYPSSFDFDVFKTLKSFNKRVQYCEQHLTRISSGSSRIVYLVDDDKVLKLAKNQKGIAQNNVEISLGNEGYYTCFADVYDYDNDGLWLEMEFCRKAKKSDFKRIYGIPFEVLCYGIAEMVEYRNKFNPFNKYKPYWKQLMNSENDKVLEFIDSFREYIGGQGLETTGDLYRISSYGVTKDNRIVLVDYGLDDDVYNNYYRRRIR